MDAELMDPDELLTPSEVASLLYVDPKTVTRWAKAGKLRCFRTPGGHRRFLKSDIHQLVSDGRHGHGRSAQPFFGSGAAFASPLGPAVSVMPQGRWGTTPATGDRQAAAATVVAQAVTSALEAQEKQAARAVELTAQVVAEAAGIAADAAEKARRATADAAAVAAHTVARDAARTAKATQVRADARALELAEAASKAAAIVATASRDGDEREPARRALKLAAVVRSAAVSTAADTAAAAASTASAVTAEAADVASKVSAAAVAIEGEVARAAATLQASATAAARRVAADTDAQASSTASVARAAAVAKVLEESSDGGVPSPVPALRGGGSEAGWAVRHRVPESIDRGR